MIQKLTNIDGTIYPTEEAAVPVMDRGFLYGDSVYEVFRTYRGVPLFMAEHFERIENSARLIEMKISQSRAELTEQIKETAQTAGVSQSDDIYVRYQITRGEGPINLYPDPALETRYVIIVAPLQVWPAHHYEQGLTMAVPEVRRNPVNALDPNIKGGNYLNNVIAVMQARRLGADESLILSSNGYVTEASNSNVWFVIDGKTVTPGSGNLRGLTKAAIFDACQLSGVEVEEREVFHEELCGATECFVTSATREVMPVRSLLLTDGKLIEFPAGGGTATRHIQTTYKDYIEDYVQSHINESFIAHSQGV